MLKPFEETEELEAEEVAEGDEEGEVEVEEEAEAEEEVKGVDHNPFGVVSDLAASITRQLLGDLQCCMRQY